MERCDEVHGAVENVAHEAALPCLALPLLLLMLMLPCRVMNPHCVTQSILAAAHLQAPLEGFTMEPWPNKRSAKYQQPLGQVFLGSRGTCSSQLSR